MASTTTTVTHPDGTTIVTSTRTADTGLAAVAGVAAGAPSATDAGPLLYTRAKEIIPGGVGLLSKRPELYLPDLWPAYYSKAKGAHVWDLDGRKYVDMINAPGCYLLGAADPDVNRAVHEAVDNGSFSTLNAPEEVELAELLVELHPWAAAAGGMVRYARGGGEIMMMAVRIARAHTKRDCVAMCGYHGWTDFYLAANLDSSKGGGGKNALGKHWLSDVEPVGVPSKLHGTSFMWDYGDVASLRRIFEQNPGDVAAVVMEVAREEPPPKGFLEEVRAIADEFGAVLVFDEVSAGWRDVCGGRHLQYGVAPDIATFSKTISNGFAMAALVGRSSVMQATQDTFISTTYHTERIGPVAALATLRKFLACDVQRVVGERGHRIKQGWLAAAKDAGLEVSVHGFDAWPRFAFAPVHCAGGPEASRVLYTLFTQEMLLRGYLANSVVVPTFAHDDAIVDAYLASVREVFGVIGASLREHGGEALKLKQLLKGGVKHSGPQRV